MQALINAILTPTAEGRMPHLASTSRFPMTAAPIAINLHNCYFATRAQGLHRMRHRACRSDPAPKAQGRRLRSEVFGVSHRGRNSLGFRVLGLRGSKRGVGLGYRPVPNTGKNLQDWYGRIMVLVQASTLGHIWLCQKTRPQSRSGQERIRATQTPACEESHRHEDLKERSKENNHK